MNGPSGDQWQVDTELKNFEQTRLPVSYKRRTLQATLVRATGNPKTAKRAVLYIHGLTDYFFQVHMADAYRAQGYAFYALDLHGYGRSLRADERPNYCENIAEYYPEIDAAIEHIKSTGVEQLVINTHSTGSLIAAMYAHEGRYRDTINALYLNSPFFEFPLRGWQPLLLRVIVALGRWFPYIKYNNAMPSLYAKSIHRDFYGEWSYNKKLKPSNGFAITAGWARAIYIAQRRLQKGLDIRCPVLVMHSAKSVRVWQWSDELLHADSVLNVDDMRRFGPGLGEQVELACIDGAMHDLALSSAAVRAEVFRVTFLWLEQVLGKKQS
ncbi:alpha/beta hydrolase [Gilvimarinus polysaccharolyticus]|uniref:alpha/beta hydrolase n=1 Tax=Gilvimarinus polysaccharolyticus TaxID=863921 RepID=UPI000673971F|nr:alpha/beta hydrolase [Gilvimarinus polysaccharolyticus]